MQVQFLGWEDTLEKEMATCCSILAWKKSHGQRSWTGDIPWDPERVGQELVTKQQQCVILHLTDCLSNSVMQSRY